MAKNRNKEKGEEDSRENKLGLKTQTKHVILAVVFFVFALFFLMSYFEMTGVAGKFIYEKLYYLLGIGYILLPALLVLLGYSFIKSKTPDIGWRSLISATMFLLSALSLIDIASGKDAGGMLKHSGGFIGRILSTPLVSLFDIYASIVFLGAILIISILVISNEELEVGKLFKKIWNFITRKKIEEVEHMNKTEESVTGPLDASGEVLEEETSELGEEDGMGKKIKKALGINKESEEEEEEEMPIKKRRSGFVSTYT